LKKLIRVFYFIDYSHPNIRLLIENLKMIPMIKIFHFNYSVRKEVIRRIRDLMRSDIIHFHWIEYLIRSKNLFFTWIFLIFWIFFINFFKKMGKKIVVTLHNIQPRNHEFPKTVYIFFKKFLKSSDLIIAHNNYTVKLSKIFYNIPYNRFEIIPHGNFYEYYLKIKAKAINSMALKKNTLKVLYFGNIRRYKGIEKIVEIAKQLSGNELVSFVVAGRCVDVEICNLLLDSLKKLKNLNVILKFLTDGEIRYLVESCDIGFIPYKSTTTPGSMLLFLSFGKPVIVPLKEPLIEYCRNSRACFMYRESEWKKDIIDILTKLMKDKKLLKEKKRNAKRYTRKLEWKNLAIDTFRSYLKTLKLKL